MAHCFTGPAIPTLTLDERPASPSSRSPAPSAGFALARFALGLGEAGNFPASIKTVAEWFPRKERAFATGIFNSGTNIGALITPLVVPWITLTWGWQWAFIATGALGFLWLVVVAGDLPHAARASAAVGRRARATSRAIRRRR